MSFGEIGLSKMCQLVFKAIMVVITFIAFTNPVDIRATQVVHGNTPHAKVPDRHFDLLLQLVRMSPIDGTFDYTTEGITEREKKILLKAGESKYWKMTAKTPFKIEVTCKFPYSKIQFHLDYEGDKTYLIAKVINERVVSYHAWLYDKKKSRLIEVYAGNSPPRQFQ